jgi:hypothetical protein
MENGCVEHNPVRGVRWSADKQKNALLTSEQYRWLALALDWLDARRDANAERMHSAVGLAAIRFIALSGVRRGEAPPSNVVQFQPRGRWSAVTEPSARLSCCGSKQSLQGSAPACRERDYTFWLSRCGPR